MNDIEIRETWNPSGDLCLGCAEFYFDTTGFLSSHCDYLLHSFWDRTVVEKCKHFVTPKGISKWDSMSKDEQELLKEGAKKLWEEKMKNGEILPGSGIETAEQFVEFCIESNKLKDVNAR